MYFPSFFLPWFGETDKEFGIDDRQYNCNVWHHPQILANKQDFFYRRINYFLINRLPKLMLTQIIWLIEGSCDDLRNLNSPSPSRARKSLPNFGINWGRVRQMELCHLDGM